MQMNRDLIGIIVVFMICALTVGISNSLRAPKRPAPATLPPEPVAGDIAIELVPEQAENDTMTWRATVVVQNVAGHPLLLRSPRFGAKLILAAGSSGISSEEHSLERHGNYTWGTNDIHRYGIGVWLQPSGSNQTREFLLTVHYGTASATCPGVSASASLNTPYELVKMTVSNVKY